MSTTITLYEQYRDMLIKQQRQLMVDIKKYHDECEEHDRDRMNFITEMMDYASTLNTYINGAEQKIRTLKRRGE